VDRRVLESDTKGSSLAATERDPWADVGNRSVSRRFAALVTKPTYQDLPPQTVEYAKMLLASTVASAAAGTQVRTAQIVRKIIRERWGVEQATVWFEHGATACLSDAVRLNAVRSSAAASDDSDLRNLMHAGTAVTTAALAAGERHQSTGEQVITAIVLAYEAAARLGAAITPGFRLLGFHGCIASIFGAAVAAGRVMGLDAEQMTHAVSLAATTASGLLRSADVSNSREHQDSMAAALGVEVALAAGHGFTGDEWVLEGNGGYFEVFGQASATAGESALCDGFGESWAIVTAMAIKLVPGGHLFHAAAEASAQAVGKLGISGEEISSIRISAPGLESVRGPLHPSSLLEMAHSQAYFAAAAAADGAFSWIHATPEKIADPKIHRLIDLVAVDPDPCESPESYRLGATVTVHARDGRSARVTVFEPRGSGMRGISWDDIAEKYRALVPASGMRAGDIENSLRMIRALDELRDLSPLISVL
jgi:2-methylcitrate dehydratase PrpD